VPVPAGFVTAMGPLSAAEGTLARSCASDSSVNEAETAPKRTRVAPVKLLPVTTTSAPGRPLAGLNDATEGRK